MKLLGVNVVPSLGSVFKLTIFIGDIPSMLLIIMVRLVCNLWQSMSVERIDTNT